MESIDPLKAGMQDFTRREVPAVSAHAKGVLNGAPPALSPTIQIEQGALPSHEKSGSQIKTTLLHAPIGICGALAVSHVATPADSKSDSAQKIRKQLAPLGDEHSTATKTSPREMSSLATFCSALSTLHAMTQLPRQH